MKNTTAREATERLKSMLVHDKVQAPEGFSDILRADISRVLSDYFEIVDNIAIEINLTETSDFDIQISTKANRVKTFYCAK